MLNEKGLLLCDQKLKISFGGNKIVKDDEEIISISNNYDDLKKEDKLKILKLAIEVFYEELFNVKKGE